VTHREEWLPRWQRGRDTMHEAAIKGVPNTAMAAKGGYAKLSDDEVKAAVDYILARTGFQENLVVKSSATGASATTQSNASGAAVDDNTLQKQVAEALRNGMANGAQIENVEGKLLVRGVNIRVSVRDGAVTLEGMLAKPDIISRAEQIAKSVNGVRRIDNKLVASGLFDWD
jgi:osmotically-inducible protein OsmY